MSQTIQLHASCISIGGKGVLLLGDSGSGKSDLALRLIDGGAILVGDDRIDVLLDRGHLQAAAPERLRGLLEVRGVGILTMPYQASSEVVLAVQLVAVQEIERLPEQSFFDCLGKQLPLLCLYAFEVSSCAKIRLWLNQLASS